MSSSVHIDNKNKYILIVAEGQTQGLDDTTLTAGAKYPVSFTLVFLKNFLLPERIDILSEYLLVK